ncbi:hypothetical protein MXB_3906 [Myxobolus squamalis]|nr:hypothetical protein MXB_3906 [Myxobolus squamalis]
MSQLKVGFLLPKTTRFMMLRSMPFDTKLYDILGVDPLSSMNAIQSAYLKKSKILHPDKNPNGSSEAMQELTEAKKILLDPKLRSIYDAGGLASVILHQSSLRIPKNVIGRTISKEYVNSCYQDVYINYTTTLKNMYLGVECILSYPVKDFCFFCSPGIDFQSNVCGTCLGWGVVESKHCCKCNGTGILPCNRCNDTKFIKKTRQKTIQVFNADDGLCIIEKAFGNEYAEGHSDLVIVINLIPHPIFKKYNDDILMEMELNIIEALVGFTKVFKYIDDLYYNITSKDDVISHNDFRVVIGLGLKSSKFAGRGNLVIIFKIIMSTKFPDPISTPYLISAFPLTLNNSFRQVHSIVTMIPVTSSN